MIIDYKENKKDKSYILKSFNSQVIDKRCPIKLKLDRLFIWDDNSFFSEYFSESEQFIEIRNMLNKREKVANKSGISSRVLNHWANEKILPEGMTAESGEWKKFSVLELVWVRAVHVMREYGLPLKKISVIRSWVMQYDGKSDTYPWFEYYIALARISTHDDPNIIILSDGTAELATSKEIEDIKFFNKIDRHFLIISLKSILTELGFSVPKPSRLQLLSEPEIAIRSAVIRGSKKINISITKDETDLDITEMIFDDQSIRSLGKEIEKEGLFGEVTSKYSKGTIQSVQFRERKRFKNK